MLTATAAATQAISGRINSNHTLKQTLEIISKETIKPQKIVPRVTSELVDVSKLSFWAAIHDEEGHVRDRIPRTKLIIAIVDDLKQLRRVSD